MFVHVCVSEMEIIKEIGMLNIERERERERKKRETQTERQTETETETERSECESDKTSFVLCGCKINKTERGRDMDR